MGSVKNFWVHRGSAKIEDRPKSKFGFFAEVGQTEVRTSSAVEFCRRMLNAGVGSREFDRRSSTARIRIFCWSSDFLRSSAERQNSADNEVLTETDVDRTLVLVELQWPTSVLPQLQRTNSVLSELLFWPNFYFGRTSVLANPRCTHFIARKLFTFYPKQ